MKISLNWLRDYVAVDMSVPELAERLTIAGLEVESVRLFGVPTPDGLRVKQVEPGPIWDRDKIVTAQVIHIEKHPEADKLKLVDLEYGAPEPKRVVTGAPNIAVGDSGQKVILGLTGSKLFDGHTKPGEPKKLAELKPTKLRGIPSDSMVCSAFELGINDEHEGIILLSDDTPVGVPLMDFIGDVVLEADVLPNMARCLGMLGIAGEVAALTGANITPPPVKIEFIDESIDTLVKVQIDDADRCPRYQAMLIRDVTLGPSPSWMQYRLTYAGVRPINNLVDATNYVMLEYGQPLHAFDYDTLVTRAQGKTPTIIIRPAKAGEVLVTLDEKERKLSPDDLVIADTAGPIALAGVMGGLDTEVTDATRHVLLEAANFDPVLIRRTARKFDLHSDASARFARGLDPDVVAPAAHRAAFLMQEHAGGRVVAGSVDAYPKPPHRQAIRLRASEIRRLLGIEVDPADVERVLTGLRFEVSSTKTHEWDVTPPVGRTDIQAGEADLIEEIARIHGYDHLPATLLADVLPEQQNNRDLIDEERVRDLLAMAGLQEAINYSLTDPKIEKPFGFAASDHVTLKNPISPERGVLRRSLLPGLLISAASNLKHAEGTALFEIGPVFVPRAGERLPEEPRRLGIVLCGRRTPPAWDDPVNQRPPSFDFFDLKGIIEELISGLHLNTISYRHAEKVAHLHPARSAEVFLNGKPVGTFGELHPRAAALLAKEAKTLDPAERSAYVAELDLEAILSTMPERFAYSPVSRYEVALRDVAILLDASVSADAVRAELLTAGGELLQDARLFDVYQGEHIPDGKKSLAYALVYQASDRTLTDKEIDKAHKKIEDRLRKQLKAQIRGKDTTT